MASSDIYEVKESPWAKPAEKTPKRRRRRRPVETFDDAVNKDISNTHHRRNRNSGFRRFQHLMKRPEFSKKFWIITLGTAGLILVLLIIWDRFFRYPNPQHDPTQDVYRAGVE
jgi:hypothetical protein